MCVTRRPSACHTLTAPGSLNRQLARIRTTGLAASHEEYRLGELSLAARVLRDGAAVSAVSVTPSTRRPYERAGAAVQEAARAVGRALTGA